MIGLQGRAVLEELVITGDVFGGVCVGRGKLKEAGDRNLAQNIAKVEMTKVQSILDGISVCHPGLSLT
jgi:ribosomal protein S5